jgi:anthranilate phosphoribosyltransferase
MLCTGWGFFIAHEQFEIETRRKNMKHMSRIILDGPRREKQLAREALAVGYNARVRLAELPGAYEALERYSLGMIDRKVKHGQDLTFEEAFSGMAYVVAATNECFFEATAPAFSTAYRSPFTPEKAVACGTAFMQLMAAKESFKHLTAEEVAGIAAASLMDTVIRLDPASVVETSGMGGDVGFVHNGVIKKTINVSTLSALVLAALGLPVAKHGSYGNTSAVGSTEAIELFGANTTLRSIEQVERVWRNSHFAFLDAHWCKTIHDLSHLIMMETINHVAGPMSAPFAPRTSITKLMGVNEKVHPSVIARAYALLHEKGLQRNAGVAIVCGLDIESPHTDPYDLPMVREHTIVDELSPFSSVVAIAHQDMYRGSFLVTPGDFGITIPPTSVHVVNDKEHILAANQRTLQNTDEHLVNYLAMNAALPLFMHRYGDRADCVVRNQLNTVYLQECFLACKQAITSGGAWNVLQQHVLESQKEA